MTTGEKLAALRKRKGITQELYPMIRQEYLHQDEMFFVIFRLDMEAISIQ